MGIPDGPGFPWKTTVTPGGNWHTPKREDGGLEVFGSYSGWWFRNFGEKSIGDVFESPVNNIPINCCSVSSIKSMFLFLYMIFRVYVLEIAPTWSTTDFRKISSHLAAGYASSCLYECFQKWRIQNLWSHACCISANHTPNHAPESYPRIIPPKHTSGSAREGETYPETYPRIIPPKHTSNHTPWCNTLCWARSFRKRPIYRHVIYSSISVVYIGIYV